MKIQTFHFAHVEQFRDEFYPDTALGVLQLSRGHLDLNSTQVDLDGIRLEWNRIGSRIRSREIHRGSGVMFGFVLKSPSPLKLCGKELDCDHAVLWPHDEEMEYITAAGLASLVIHVDAALVDLLGWTLADDLHRQVPVARLRKLERTCRLATRDAQKSPSVVVEASADCRSARDASWWRDRIIIDLEHALMPWLTPCGPANKSNMLGAHNFRRVKEAEHFFMQHDTDPMVSVDAVAKALGLPRRTLFRAFREYLGLGPYAYLHLVRLHTLRDRLLAASPDKATVTSLANELGFEHMGRLSAIYYRQFGEYPSDTLKNIERRRPIIT